MTVISPLADIVELSIPGLSPGLKMQLHGADDQVISTRLRRDQYWEYYETLITLKYLQPGEVYVDVGANIGYYTLVAARRVGLEGTVISYEPDPENFALLQHNVAMNALPQVQIFPYALYDKNVEGELFLSDDNYGDHRIYASPEVRNARQIRLVSGDEHLSQHTGKIDFLKIDTQGAEFFVVKGLGNVIAQNRDNLRMILEFSPFGIRHSGASGHDLLGLLDGLDMQYHIIDHLKQRLVAVQSRQLAQWVTETDQAPGNEGFMNLFVTPTGYSVDQVC